jgi:hypothetical protein
MTIEEKIIILKLALAEGLFDDDCYFLKDTDEATLF